MARRAPLLAVLISTFCCIGLARGATAPSLYSRLGGGASMRAHDVPLAARNELLEALAPLRLGP
jgi:hypothetical protein